VLALAPKGGLTCDRKCPGAIRIRLTLRRDAGEIQRQRSKYGDPVLEWRRPGGSVLAIRGQGSQADLSLPPRCDGVSQ